VAIRVRLIVGWVAGSFLVSGFVAVPGVEALVLPGWSVSGVVAGDGGLSPLGMDTDRLVSGGVVGVGVVPGVEGLRELSGGVLPDGPKGLTPARFDPLRAKVSGRGAQFTEFVNPDGSSTRVVSPEVVNFKDSAGVWRPVDSGLESDPGIVGGLRSKSNSWRARFGLASKGVAWESA